VSAHDASGHALAWIGSAVGARQIPLGVERFGESGTIPDLYDVMGISAAHMVNAALLAVDPASS
jgi:pyruvate dehydrogenase E1 component